MWTRRLYTAKQFFSRGGAPSLQVRVQFVQRFTQEKNGSELNLKKYKKKDELKLCA